MHPPVKKTSFSRGQGVEVSIKEDRFHGSYFEAKVVSQLDNGMYVVKYETLLDDHNESQFLTETDYPMELRPLPPVISVRRFSLSPEKMVPIGIWCISPPLIRRSRTQSHKFGFIRTGLF
ncbi:hypothetical protein K1719_003041 [Acacia pycnantha]|nr:hypothetical protein K1719_003041 [Acacia pycnantha]